LLLLWPKGLRSGHPCLTSAAAAAGQSGSAGIAPAGVAVPAAAWGGPGGVLQIFWRRMTVAP